MTITVRGLEQENEDVVNRLLEFIDEKSRRNRLRRRYYDGKRYTRFLGLLIPPQYYRLAIVLGWSAKAVDMLARRCNLTGFQWADGKLEDAGHTEVWTDNQFQAESNSAIIESLIHGVSFLINTRGGAGEPNSLIHVKNAFDGSGDWDPRTRRLSNFLSVLGRDDKGDPNHLCLYLDGETVEMMTQESGWAVVERSPHAWGMPVEAMVYKPRTSRPFGSSRISRPVMSLHDAALRTVLRMEGHADFYSVPELWLLGADEAIFQNPDGSPRSPWQVMMGRIKAIPDDDEADAPELARADVKQIQQSSPTPHIQFLKVQAQQFSAETSIPVTSLGIVELTNPTSADAYVASREDLIAEAEGATDDWSTPLSRCWARALAMANGEPVSPRMATITPQWRSPLYLSRAAEADAGAKIVASVPRLADTDVGLELLGLTPSQIERFRKEVEALDAGDEVEAQSQAPEDVRGAPPQGVQ